MRNLLIILFLAFSINFYGQKNEKLISHTAEKIEIEKSDIYSRLTTSLEFENGTLIIIPEVAEKEEGYITFNSHIVLIDSRTDKKDWYIDAVAMKEITIEPRLYHLNKSTVAYGIKISYSGQSRADPYYATHLSLYALTKGKLYRVLKDYPVKSFKGETDTTCKGKLEEHSKQIELSPTTKKYAKLKVTDTIKLSERNEDCEVITQETIFNTEILKFKNGEYKNMW